MSKPRMIEFFLQNIPLRRTLELRARWHLLSAQEIAELGFSPEAREARGFASREESATEAAPDFPAVLH